MFEVSITHTLGYIDGGTGSMIFQAAMGGILAAGYFVTTQWTKVKSMLSGRNRKVVKPIQS